MKKRIFAVDGNWYLWRAFHSLRTNRPIEVALPLHLLNMVCKDALRVRADYLAVAFDGPKVFRYKVYPKYKWERKHKKGKPIEEGADVENAVDDSLYQYLPHIYTLFADARIITYQPRFGEADDVLCSIANEYAGSTYTFIGGAWDKDAFQWLRTKCAMLFDPSFKNKAGDNIGRYFTAEMAEARIGLKVSQLLDYQTLIGDKGDSIPPITGYGPKTAVKILTEYGTIRKWYEQDQSVRQFLIEQQENLKRNRTLVTLRKDMTPPAPLEFWRLPKVKSQNRDLPRNYHDYHAFLWPRSKGLF